MNGEGVKDHLISLVEFAKSVDLEEVVWENEGRRIAFRRRMNGVPPPAAVSASTPAAEKKNGSAPGPRIEIITSPMVGTFLRAAAKDRPPLVVEGGEVVAGQKVGAVEAMKILKDVISHVSGKITKILVENGKPVEYGQKLFEVQVKE